MNYIIDYENKGSYFSVPYIIVNKHLKKSPEGFIKVLLYILSEGEGSFLTDDIADKTGIDENEVHSAISFWVSKKVIRCDSVCSQNSPDLMSEQHKHTEVKPEVKAVNPSPESLSKKISVRYSPKDIEKIVEGSPELKILMDNSQIIMKRPIKHSEQGSLINIHEYYGFSVSVILMLLEYCEKIGKSSIGYVEAVAKSWFEKGISDHSSAEKEIIKLLERSSLEKQVAKTFGLETKLTPTQTAYIEKWNSFEFDIDIIAYAYEKCVDSLNKLSFPYINKILESWAEKGYKTREQASSETPPAKKKASTVKPEKEHSYNLDDFYKMALHSTPDFKGE